MEGLMQLVAESFARHGIDVSPASDLKPAEPTRALADTVLPAALPEHNYRKIQANLAP